MYMHTVLFHMKIFISRSETFLEQIFDFIYQFVEFDKELTVFNFCSLCLRS